MLHFNNKTEFSNFAANLNKWVDKAIQEHQENKQPQPLPYKVYCKNLQDVQNRFSNSDIREVTGHYNMLMLRDNEFGAVCNDGKFYIVTI